MTKSKDESIVKDVQKYHVLPIPDPEFSSILSMTEVNNTYK